MSTLRIKRRLSNLSHPVACLLYCSEDIPLCSDEGYFFDGHNLKETYLKTATESEELRKQLNKQRRSLK